MFGKSNKLVMCQACRGLIDSSLRTCPLCGRDSVPAAPVRLRVAEEHSQFFTKLLLGINVVMFVIMTAVGMSASGSGDVIISGLKDGAVLLDFGVKSYPLIHQGQVWRLVSANFIHFGILHLGFNCFALYQIGPLVEETYGSQKFIFIYLVTGILGFTFSSFYAPNVPSAGASASIMGLIGLIAVFGYKLGGMAGRALMRQMVMWAAITLGIGLFGIMNMDNGAHIGGLVAGVALGYLIKPEQPVTARAANVWNVVTVGCALLIVGSFAMVGLKYGNQQRGRDSVVLDSRILGLRKALADSYSWSSASDGDAAKIAFELHNASDDFKSVNQIDEQADSLKSQFVQIGEARAALFDAAKNPAAIVSDTPKSEKDFEELYRRYLDWANGVKDRYGFYFKTESVPQ